MKLMPIEVLTGPQGGGKSTVMREEAIARSGRYLFAAPTHKLIDELVRDFQRDAPDLEVHRVDPRTRKGKAVRQLTEFRQEIERRNIGHCIVFTTHATLMDHPLEGFDGWHIRIDEAPAAVQAGRFNISVIRRAGLKDTFEVQASDGSEWSLIKPRRTCPNWKAVERDTGAKDLSEFIKCAEQPHGVFVKVRSWDDADDIEWFSMWTPLSLSHFASVQIAGSSYTDSVGFKAAIHFFENRWALTTRPIARPRTAQPLISIHYFTRGHEGTTAYWATEEGLRMLAPVEDYLVENLPPSAFWSGNEIVKTVMFGRMKATFIKPLAAGLNGYREATGCAFIFSAKATKEDAPVMDVFGLSKEDIQHAREDDAIAQFVMRGAIRERTYGGPYPIYLYCKSQAERLKTHLSKIGFTSVDLVPLDEAGIMDAERPDTGQSLTPQQKTERAEERRVKNNDKKKSKRAAAAKAEGREPSANNGRGGRPKGSKDKRARRRRARGESIAEPRIGVQKLDAMLQAADPHPVDCIVYQESAAELTGLQGLPAQEGVRGAVEDRARGT